MQTLNVARAFARQLLARAQQSALLLCLRVWNKARADEPMSEQVSQPCGVVYISLSARHVLHMRRIGEHQHEIAIAQDIPDRLPVDACRLHRDVRNALRGKPFRKGEKAARRRLEGAHLARHLRSRHSPGAGDGGVFMNIEASAIGIKDIHNDPPQGAPPAWNFRQRNSKNRAPGSQKIRGAFRGAWKFQIKLSKELNRTKRKPISQLATLTNKLPRA